MSGVQGVQSVDANPQRGPYRNNVLGIRVTVSVTLATKRMPLERILGLFPGSIIQFNKPWDAPLQLEAGGQAFAEGTTVKIGDKFGLKLTQIGLPNMEDVD